MGFHREMCVSCGRAVQLRGDFTFRVHRRRDGSSCSESGQLPKPILLMRLVRGWLELWASKPGSTIPGKEYETWLIPKGLLP